MTVAGQYLMAASPVIIDIELLGPFRVRSDSHDIPLTPTQELVLLDWLSPTGTQSTSTPCSGVSLTASRTSAPSRTCAAR